MPKPVCVKCQCFFRPKQNDYAVVEAMPIATPARIGKMEPEKWKPYKLWNADLWECPCCGTQIVVGFGRTPVAEHFQEGFKERMASYGAKLQINDT